MAKQGRQLENNNKQSSANFSSTSLSSIASPASFSINVSSVNSAIASQIHIANEEAKEGSSQHLTGGLQSCGTISGLLHQPHQIGSAAREARSLQRRLMASNDIHEAFKFTQLMVRHVLTTLFNEFS